MNLQVNYFPELHKCDQSCHAKIPEECKTLFDCLGKSVCWQWHQTRWTSFIGSKNTENIVEHWCPIFTWDFFQGLSLPLQQWWNCSWGCQNPLCEPALCRLLSLAGVALLSAPRPAPCVKMGLMLVLSLTQNFLIFVECLRVMHVYHWNKHGVLN